MKPDRWEHGSDLHWMDPASAARYPWTEEHALFGCGRFALNAVIEQGAWRRLWIPSFYCPEVIAALPRGQLELAVYLDSPTVPLDNLARLDVADGDAILVVNTLGLRAAPPEVPHGVAVIEDHTHDLTSDWATRSKADYCVASLRKILPVADGGVVWSPVGKALPVEPALDAAHARAALDRLSGSLLKSAYLAGGAIDKSVFRAHAVAGEQALARGPSSGVLSVTRAALPGFPVATWRATRAANFAAFAQALGQVPGLRLLAPSDGAVAYVATLWFDAAERRDAVRAKLISEQIYPAVLWALDEAVFEVPDEARELSRRVLSLHCDQRYNAADMQRVAHAVRRAML